MSTRNYYEVLGLAQFADGVMVDQAYWHLAKTYQTLAVADPRARLQLDELNEAYGVLGTPRLREEYDESLGQAAGPSRRRAGRKARTPKAAPGRQIRFSLPRWHLFGQSANDVQPAASDRPAALAGSLSAATERATGIGTPVNAPRGRKSDIGDLRASTARMLDRWRTNAGIRSQADGGRAPDTTLVDIFKTEKELESHGDPLAAVMEILRAPADVVPVKTEG
ncbi:MAG: DnaJ domain-containing protein [Chloroflexi bacterium]|nr:DnaJ domain-containing protein [Chloroflexota bacterium]